MMKEEDVAPYREPPETTPVEDLFDFSTDGVDFMSAESFPASDPPPPPSSIAPSEPWSEDPT
jgi:hypothetical protein